MSRALVSSTYPLRRGTLRHVIDAGRSVRVVGRSSLDLTRLRASSARRRKGPSRYGAAAIDLAPGVRGSARRSSPESPGVWRVAGRSLTAMIARVRS